MTVIHPGRLYLETHQIEALSDILPYADFLRAEAGITDQLPVDLFALLDHFGLAHPQQASLPDQQALLLDSECGSILLNSEDPARRQRFSLAHELVEMLFSVLPQRSGLAIKPGGFSAPKKEKICDQVAANLLMPPRYVQQVCSTMGIHFETAILISDECNVSRTAALVQMARLSSRKHFVVLWRMKNKPTEIRNSSGQQQMALFPTTNNLPPKKLRVEWSIGSPSAPYIPKDKSTEKDSLIYQAWEKKEFTSGKERMTFDNKASGWFTSENTPFQIGADPCVLSLVEHVSG